MSDEPFKLPCSSYDELCKLIVAYGRQSGPASLTDVSHLAGVATTTISANNAFLANIGVIEGGQSKSPTEVGKRLAAALEHSIVPDIRKTWQDIISNNEFLNKMVLSVKIRKAIESTSMESHIAYSAGQAKSSRTATGARTVIEILKGSGLVQEADGKLTLADNIEQSFEAAPKGTSAPATHGAPPTPTVSSGKESMTINTNQNANLTIELRIEAKPSELEGLGAQIRKLLDEIAASPAQQKESNH
jgi:hypothetical protein